MKNVVGAAAARKWHLLEIAGILLQILIPGLKFVTALKGYSTRLLDLDSFMVEMKWLHIRTLYYFQEIKIKHFCFLRKRV